MKKQLLFIALFLAFATQSFGQAAGETFEDGDLAYIVLGNVSTVNVTGLSAAGAAQTALVIPLTATDGTNQFDVIRINSSAFLNNTTIQTLAISASVKQIFANAFKGCNQITSIDFPTHTAPQQLQFKASAFQGCTKLASVDFSGSIIDLQTNINIFQGCNQMISFKTGATSGITEIPLGFLGGCTSLQEVDFTGATITSIGNNAFSNTDAIVNFRTGTDDAITLILTPFTNKTENSGNLITPTAAGQANFNAVTGWTTYFSLVTYEGEVLATEDFETTNGFNLYPNPTTDKISVTKEAVYGTIYSVLGQEVKSFKTKQQEFDVSDLANGAYFFNAKFENGVETTIRFIKQ